jgi:hypothetical protein
MTSVTLGKTVAAVVHAKDVAQQHAGLDAPGTTRLQGQPSDVGCDMCFVRDSAARSQSLTLVEDIGHIGDGEIARDGEVLAELPADLGRSPAARQSPPDEGGGGVQGVKPLVRRIEKQAFLAEEMNAQSSGKRQVRHALSRAGRP